MNRLCLAPFVIALPIVITGCVGLTSPSVKSVGGAPSITTQPISQMVLAGKVATFTVAATGTPPLNYQWRRNGTPINSATSSVYTTAPTTNSDSGALFTVVVTNRVGSVTSGAAMLTVSGGPVAPSITTQPVSQTVTVGHSATFAVTAAGTTPLIYQWRKSGVDIPGATSSSYTTAATTSADNGAQHNVTITNSAGSVTSNTVTLNVNALPGQLTASASTLGFGNVNVGSSSVLGVTFVNSGSTNISISSVSIAGAGFNASGIPAGLALASGQTASLSVTFAPAAAGSVAGSVVVTSDASNSPASITLSGAGVQPVAHSASLSWVASSSTVIGYNVYRGTVSGGPYALLNTALVAATQYTDANVESGHTYYYVVTAVDSSNRESSYSNQSLATIPTP